MAEYPVGILFGSGEVVLFLQVRVALLQEVGSERESLDKGIVPRPVRIRGCRPWRSLLPFKVRELSYALC